MDHSTSGKAPQTRRWAVAALLFVTIVAFYWKLTLTRQFTWTRGPDLAEQVLPWFQLQAREWHAGRIPLWDPYTWVGQPLIGQGQPGVAYPLNWLLFAMPLVDGRLSPVALNWYYVIIHFMAAAFAYLFCRDLGRSRPAAFAAGLIFALSGFLGTTDWPQMMNGAVWIPLVFLFQFRALRGDRPIANAALSGMFLGIAFLSGHHQVPVFTTLAWALVWLWYVTRDRRLWTAAALGLIVLACTSAAQTLPAYEYGRLARRWVGAPEPVGWDQSVPYSVHAHYDLKAFSLFGLVFPEAKMHYDPFIGVVALTLALLAIAACWRDPCVRLLAILGMGALVYSLGHNSVYQGLLYAITPDLDKARSPSAIVALMQFAAAALAAFGLDQLRDATPSPWLRRARWTLLVFGVVALTISLQAVITHSLHYPGDDRIVLTGVIALVLAALLLRPALTPIPLIILLIFELGNCGQYNLLDLSDKQRNVWLTELRANRDVADYLRQQPGFQRAEVPYDAFAENWGTWNEVEMVGGKLASLTFNVLESEFFSQTGRRMWGVAYVLSAKPEPQLGDPAFTGAGGLKVYRRADPYPRAWAVHPEPCTAPDKVQLVEHLPDRLSIKADLACPGTVILSDTYYPGWRARLDHRPTQIHPVNGAMRGVAVPKGAHVVTMRYRPLSVYLGAALSLLGILCALVLFKTRKRFASTQSSAGET